MKQRSIPRGSVEYVEALLFTEDDPTAATLHLSLTPAGGTHTWLPAGWVEPPSYDSSAREWVGRVRTNAVVNLSTANYPASTYTVYAQATKGGEVVPRPCWELRIT